MPARVLIERDGAFEALPQHAMEIADEYDVNNKHEAPHNSPTRLEIHYTALWLWTCESGSQQPPGPLNGQDASDLWRETLLHVVGGTNNTSINLLMNRTICSLLHSGKALALRPSTNKPFLFEFSDTQ